MSAAPISLKDAVTREERMRWARWAVRFFARFLPPDERAARGLPAVESSPPLFRGRQSMPLVRMAKRWGEHPETWAQAAEIARRGYRVMDEMRDTQRGRGVKRGTIVETT